MRKLRRDLLSASLVTLCVLAAPCAFASSVAPCGDGRVRVHPAMLPADNKMHRVRVSFRDADGRDDPMLGVQVDAVTCLCNGCHPFPCSEASFAAFDAEQAASAVSTVELLAAPCSAFGTQRVYMLSVSCQDEGGTHITGVNVIVRSRRGSSTTAACK